MKLSLFLFSVVLIISVIKNVAGKNEETIAFNFQNFNSSLDSNSFYLMDSASFEDSTGSLLLCKATQLQKGAVWYKHAMQIRGFETQFSFRIDNVTGGGEGFAFVIQNSGSDIFADGPGVSGLGYGDYQPGFSAGMPSSIAIEFDTVQNNDLGDPSNNHISIHTNGQQANSANENHSLAQALSIPWMATNQIHTVTIRYVPGKTENGTAQANLTLQFSSLGSPSLQTSFVIESYFPLKEGSMAAIGFTSSTGSQFANKHELLSWSFTFLGEATAQNTVANGTGLSEATAGVEASFNVYAYDQFGNPMITGGANLTASISSEPTLPINCTDHLDGTYSCVYTPTKSQTDAQLTVLLNGQPIQNSGFVVLVSPGPVDAAKSAAKEINGGSALSSGVAGAVSQFSIQLEDQFGNSIVNSSSFDVSVVTVTMKGNSSTIQGNVENQEGNGVLSVTYTPYVAEKYLLSIEIQGNPISNPDHNVTISPGAVNGSQCIASFGNKAPEGVAGFTYEFSIFLRDSYGNSITSISGNAPTIIAELTGTDLIKGNPTWNSTTSSYSVQMTPQTSGPYTLVITVDGANITGGPFGLDIQSQTDIWPKACTVSGLTNATAGNSTVFQLQLRDVFGNAIQTTNEDVVFNVTFTASDNKPLYNTESSFTSSYTTNGIYDITYNVTRSGQLKMTVEINGTALDQGPFDILVDPNVAYGPNSWAVGEATQEATSNKLEHFLVFTQDQWKNPRFIGGDDVQVTLKEKSAGKLETAPVVEDMRNSTYVVSYKAKKSGDYLVEVKVNGLNIQGSPFTVKCKWSGLRTPVILIIAGSVILAVILIGSIVYLYKKKFSKKRQYNRLG